MYYDTGHGEQKRMLDVFYCPKIDSALYPPHTKDPFEFDDVTNEEMKTECDHFKDKNEPTDWWDLND